MYQPWIFLVHFVCYPIQDSHVIALVCSSRRAFIKIQFFNELICGFVSIPIHQLLVFLFLQRYELCILLLLNLFLRFLLYSFLRLFCFVRRTVRRTVRRIILRIVLWIFFYLKFFFSFGFCSLSRPFLPFSFFFLFFGFQKFVPLLLPGIPIMQV